MTMSLPKILHLSKGEFN